MTVREGEKETREQKGQRKKDGHGGRTHKQRGRRRKNEINRERGKKDEELKGDVIKQAK